MCVCVCVCGGGGSLIFSKYTSGSDFQNLEFQYFSLFFWRVGGGGGGGQNQETNGPVNAHLISGPTSTISLYDVRQRSREPHTSSFTHVVNINRFPGHRLQ